MVPSHKRFPGSAERLEFWRESWARGDTAFADGRSDRLVAAHWPRLDVPLPSRVLVPLSGTSPDLAWLASRGYDAVGVEISERACERFFAERSVIPDRVEAGAFVRWRGEGVTLLQGDFFDLDGTFDAALDRGSLVSFSPDERPMYVKHLVSQLVPGAPLLVVTVEYDAQRRSGPPFSVFADEMGEHFPGCVEWARRPLRPRRWGSVGGADAVVWAIGSGRRNQGG